MAVLALAAAPAWAGPADPPDDAAPVEDADAPEGADASEDDEAPEGDAPEDDQAPEDADAPDGTEDAAAPEDAAVADEVPPPAAEPAPPEKRGPEVSTHFTDDFEARWWQIPQRVPGFEDRERLLDYVEQVNRFTANVRVGPWSMYGQLDQVSLWANTYFLDDTRQYERSLLEPGTWSLLIPGPFDPATHGDSGWDLLSRHAYVTLEKLRVQYAKGDVEVSAGDFYAAFGRGIALNANRNVDIDLDTSIQGAKVLWRPGAWDVQAVIGQLNRQQVFQDNPNRDLTGDFRHTVAGVRVDRYGLGPVNLGAHGVVYDFTQDAGWRAGFENLGGPPDVVVGGGSVEVLGAGPTDWFLEVDGFAFPTDDTFSGDPVKPGYAAYLSGAIYAGPTTWLIEGKRYFNAERVNFLLTPELYEIAVAPTLEYERAITEDSAATVNSNDVWGSRVRMDWTAIPGELVPYWSLAVYRDLAQSGLHFNTVPETVYHPMIGVEFTKDDWAVLLNIGHRFDDRDGDEFGMDRQLHGDLISKIPLAKGWYIDLSAGLEWYRWGNNPLQQNDYVEMESAFTIQKGSLLSFIYYMDYSDNPLIDSVGNISPTVYGAGEIQYKPLPALTLKAFYGAYKSGIRCSGGQCRVLPGFEGARIAFQASF